MATYIRINENHSSALLIHLDEIFSDYLALLIYNVFCNSIENTHVIITSESC